MSKPIVCVLMSTYNGENYLSQQLDSIFSQEDVIIKLIIRDDGSVDNTIPILSEYKVTKLIKGNNIGCEESFKRLLYLPIEADYYAFADQDDVWHPRKLITAINKLNDSGAGLYGCNLMRTNAKLEPQGPLFNTEEINRLRYRFNHLILGNVHGCTQVWTKSLHEQIQTYKSALTYPHDVWVNVIANMVSSTYLDSECYINYRLHGNNTSGKAKNLYQKISRGLTRYLLADHPTFDSLCRELIEGYGKHIVLEESKYESLLLVSRYKKNIFCRIKLLFSPMINYTDIERRCLNWLRVLTNKY